MSKIKILIVGIATVATLSTSWALAAPTSTIVQNLFITSLSGNGTKCLKILNSGLAQLANADCGSGGGGTELWFLTGNTLTPTSTATTLNASSTSATFYIVSALGSTSTFAGINIGTNSATIGDNGTGALIFTSGNGDVRFVDAGGAGSFYVDVSTNPATVNPFKTSGLILSDVTGPIQCLQASTSGLVTGTGVNCGSATTTITAQSGTATGPALTYATSGSLLAITCGVSTCTFITSSSSLNLQNFVVSSTVWQNVVASSSLAGTAVQSSTVWQNVVASSSLAGTAVQSSTAWGLVVASTSQIFSSSTWFKVANNLSESTNTSSLRTNIGFSGGNKITISATGVIELTTSSLSQFTNDVPFVVSSTIWGNVVASSGLAGTAVQSSTLWGQVVASSGQVYVSSTWFKLANNLSESTNTSTLRTSVGFSAGTGLSLSSLGVFTNIGVVSLGTSTTGLTLSNSTGTVTIGLNLNPGGACGGGSAVTNLSATGTIICSAVGGGAVTWLGNGSPFMSSSTVNFQQGANITITTSTNGTYTIAAAGGSPAGSSTVLQFNDGGVFAGADGLRWVSSTQTFTVSGTLKLSTLSNGSKRCVQLDESGNVGKAELPCLKNRRQMSILANPGAATVSNYGLAAAPTTRGTLSSRDDDFGAWLGITSATTSPANSSASIFTASAIFRRAWLPEMSVDLRTSSTVNTSTFLFVGMTSNTTNTTSSRALENLSAAGIFIDGTTTTAKWMTNDGSGQYASGSTNVLITASTTYNWRVQHIFATGTASVWNFYINGSLVASSTNVDMPASSTALTPIVRSTALVTSSIELMIGRIDMWFQSRYGNAW